MKKLIAIAAMLLTIITANAQNYSCQDVKTFSVKPYVGLSAGYLETERCDELDLPVTGNAVAQLTIGYRF